MVLFIGIWNFTKCLGTGIKGRKTGSTRGRNRVEESKIRIEIDEISVTGERSLCDLVSAIVYTTVLYDNILTRETMVTLL